MADTKEILLGLRSLLLTLPELPADRAWTNVEFVPRDGVPYIEEDFVPGASTLNGLVRGGTREATGLYVIRWYGIDNTGPDVMDGVDALLRLFKPGTTIPLQSGDVVRVRGDVAPFSSSLSNDGPARAVITATVPWRVYALNA